MDHVVTPFLHVITPFSGIGFRKLRMALPGIGAVIRYFVGFGAVSPG
jgi:hypothetical protein